VIKLRSRTRSGLAGRGNGVLADEPHVPGRHSCNLVTERCTPQGLPVLDADMDMEDCCNVVDSERASTTSGGVIDSACEMDFATRWTTPPSKNKPANFRESGSMS
jgi:hypothetical protein